MAHSSGEQFCFPPIERVAVRGGFDGRAAVVGLRPPRCWAASIGRGLTGWLA